MRRRFTIGTRRLACVLAIACCAVAGAVPAVASAAIGRKGAQAIALRVLKPQSLRGPVVLFGLPAPLAKGARVAEAGTPGMRRKPTAVPATRLKRRAWLFWEDRQYGALFQHPSTMLLVDAQTGRVVKRRNMSLYPMVNAAPPAFIASASGYRNPKLIVFAKVPVARSTAVRPSFARLTPPTLTLTAAVPDFKGDCLISVGDRFALGQKGPLKGKAILFGSFNAIEHWADGVGLPKSRAVTKADLLNEIAAFVKSGCRDVFVFIAGHGVPPPGLKDESGNEIPSGAPGVNLGKSLQGFDKKGNDIVKDDWITPQDIGDILNSYPGIEFKFKIESCFAGRFADELLGDATILPDHKNLRVLELSSAATQPSYAQMFDEVVDGAGKIKGFRPVITDNPYGAGEFTNGDVHGLEAWTSSADEQAQHPGLAGAIARSKELGAAWNAAVQRGVTAPEVYENPPLAANRPPISSFTFSPNNPPSGPKAGASVSFDGGASSDPDGSVTGWTWTFGGAAPPGSGTPSSPSGSGSRATVSFPSPGKYPVSLEVRDNGGATATSSQTVLVSGPGTKSDTATTVPCGTTGSPTSGYTDLYVPSYAQNVRITVQSSTCNGFTVGTQGLISGNTPGHIDEWGNRKDTYHVNWSIAGSGSPPSGNVTITVAWD
jgi:hypothetical protein